MSAEDDDMSLFTRIKQRHYGLYQSIRRGVGRFADQRVGVLGLLILIGLIVTALAAPFLAPHSLDWRAPEVLDKGGNADLPDDCSTADNPLDCRAQKESSGKTISHPAPPKFGDFTGDPYFAPLGTDHRGSDVLSRLIYGSQTALYIGLAAGLLSSLVGVPLGLISGYYGDTWIDEFIQRVIDLMFGLPFLPLVIVLVAANGITTTNIIIAIVIKSWLNNAIVIRGETLSLKERSYVEAAKVSGASDTRIVFRHIFPNVLPLAFIYLAQDSAIAVLTQANLAFLGLADFTNVSWGTMLNWIQTTGYVYDAWWWLLPPGLMITALAASFYFVGYSLEDVMNPQTSA
ncbi:ABC transporter permease [Halobacteriales archaeon QS_8_69_26]|nr:MAG: ABC transporter permease [Halobacteriales archaeon QS_8_69_26]